MSEGIGCSAVVLTISRALLQHGVILPDGRDAIERRAIVSPVLVLYNIPLQHVCDVFIVVFAQALRLLAGVAQRTVLALKLVLVQRVLVKRLLWLRVIRQHIAAVCERSMSTSAAV